MSEFYVDDINGNEVELSIDELPVAEKLGILNVRLKSRNDLEEFKPVEELGPFEPVAPAEEEVAPVEEEVVAPAEE